MWPLASIIKGEGSGKASHPKYKHRLWITIEYNRSLYFASGYHLRTGKFPSTGQPANHFVEHLVRGNLTICIRPPLRRLAAPPCAIRQHNSGDMAACQHANNWEVGAPRVGNSKQLKTQVSALLVCAIYSSYLKCITWYPRTPVLFCAGTGVYATEACIRQSQLTGIQQYQVVIHSLWPFLNRKKKKLSTLIFECLLEPNFKRSKGPSFPVLTSTFITRVYTNDESTYTRYPYSADTWKWGSLSFICYPSAGG